MLPSRASDAGPVQYGFAVFCPTCRSLHHIERGDELELTRCQGADDCEAMLCGECLRTCDGCNLPSCDECLADLSGDRFCVVCRAGMKEEAARELAEAMEAVV